MPRNGSGIYSKPAGTTAAPSTTIESAKYNATIDDLVADANTTRPASVGGTGVTNMPALLTALAPTLASITDMTAAGRALMDDADAATQRATLGFAATANALTTGGTATAVTDWNAIAASGFYYGLGTAANTPSAHRYSGFYSGDASDGALFVGRAGLEMNFTRRRGGGAWGDWMPISSGWAPANGFTGLRYDSAVNGSVASVSSSVWEDGWEYMLVYDGVGGASGNLMLSLERESGGFSGAVAISGTGNVVHYGELVFQLPRMEKFSHIATETTASLAAPANTFNTNVTYQSCGITHAVATKIKSAVLTNSAGNITSGKVYEFRRPEGTS